MAGLSVMLLLSSRKLTQSRTKPCGFSSASLPDIGEIRLVTIATYISPLQVVNITVCMLAITCGTELMTQA